MRRNEVMNTFDYEVQQRNKPETLEFIVRQWLGIKDSSH